MVLLRLVAFCLSLGISAAPVHAAVDVIEVTSPGGLSAWLVQDTSIPVTAIEFIFKGAGAVHDPAGKEGVANLTAATMDEGAGAYDSQAFRRALADRSISLSFRAGRDNFSGSLYVLNRYRSDGVELLSLALNEPRFEEDAVNRIRDRIAIGLRQAEVDPDRLAGHGLFSAVFEGHPYARKVRGTETSLPLITREEMNAFRLSALTRDRLHIGVTGDISPEELGPLLDQIFGDLPFSGAEKPLPDFSGSIPAGTAVIDVDVPQSSVRFAQKGLSIDDPRYYAGMVLNHVLGGGSFGSLLTEEVRVKRGLAYSVYSFMNAMEAASLIQGGAATQNARVAETVDLIRQVFRDVRDNGLSPQQVADAKTYITGAYPLRFTNTSSIAGQLAAMRYHGFPIDYFDTRNEFVDAVTVEDVNALAADLLDPEGLIFVIAGRPDRVTPTLSLP